MIGHNTINIPEIFRCSRFSEFDSKYQSFHDVLVWTQLFVVFNEGVKGGYRSRFTENKTALSQFTKNITLAFHASRKIKENILENHDSRQLWKS